VFVKGDLDTNWNRLKPTPHGKEPEMTRNDNSKVGNDCGVGAHDEDCLCDVTIETITQIAPIDPERFWGMRFALERKHDLDSAESILDLLEALALAKDAAVNMANFDNVDAHGVVRASSELKTQVEQWVRDGNSIIDAPRAFSTSWANVLAAITKGTPSTVWSWSEPMWAQIEDWVMAHDEWQGYRACMRTFKIERGAAMTIERLYRHASHAEGSGAASAIRSLLLRSPRQKNSWVVAKCAELGYTIARADVTAMRSRLREQNMLPARGQKMSDWRATQP